MNSKPQIKAPARIRAIVQALPQAPFDDATLCEVGYDSGLILWTALRAHPRWRGLGVEIQPESEMRVPIPTDLMGKVRLRTGDGLHPVEPGEVQGLILAGMGGNTIARILRERFEVAKNLSFVVCCASHLEGEIRPTLKELGFKLLGESLVQDRGRFYEVIVASPSEGDEWPEPGLKLWWGPQLVTRPDPLMTAFLKDQRQRFKAAFKAELDNYREGAKAGLGQKLACLDEAVAEVARAEALKQARTTSN